MIGCSIIDECIFKSNFRHCPHHGERFANSFASDKIVDSFGYPRVWRRKVVTDREFIYLNYMYTRSIKHCNKFGVVSSAWLKIYTKGLREAEFNSFLWVVHILLEHLPYRIVWYSLIQKFISIYFLCNLPNSEPIILHILNYSFNRRNNQIKLDFSVE